MEKIPSEEKLRQLIASGPETTDVAQQLIDKHKLPWLIEKNAEGKLELRSQYTQGELYLNQFITIDPETIQMKLDSIKMAASPYEVLITGDSGTGKEIIAKSMIGARKGPIKSVNCAGFPRELIESELFGYIQGSFTGAGKTRDGLLTSATGGVMFLDEVGELPMDVQSKLLRALQDRTIRKVGSNMEEKIDCKFVCATNRDLNEMVKNKTFRLDLYARISTLELCVKSLENRKCDIIPITESLPGGDAFLKEFRDELEKGVLDLSLNVRSLQKYVRRYEVLGRLT